MAKIIVKDDRFVTIPVIEWDQQDTTFQGYYRHVLDRLQFS